MMQHPAQVRPRKWKRVLFEICAFSAMTVVLGLLASSTAGCKSSRETQSSETATVGPTDSHAFRDWLASTQAITDDLLEEARQLADLDDDKAALDRIDDALCAALDPPETITGEPAYLDFVAGLLAAAEDLEHSLLLGYDGNDGGREMVALPPIEVPELPPDAIEIVGPDGLPPSDYPLVLNSTVDGFLDAMIAEGEYRNRISTGLSRSGDYLPLIRAKFREAGLPTDISYLPLIESAFSVKAYSRARAHGMWQFISSTGRHYGLEIGSLVDERRDPVRSTEAAVAYLADLFAEFDDWHLALAAYNSGAGNVRRAIRKSGSHDFWTLQRYLPRETRSYVPAFIASVIIAKDPAQWGFPVPTEREWDFDRVEVPDALDLQFLAEKTSLPVDELRELNPAIRRDLTPANRVTTLWLPAGEAPVVEAVLAETPREEWAPRMIHSVSRGESLSTIAARYNSSVGAIKQANGLRGNMIHPGQSLIVPRFGDAPTGPSQRQADNGTYVVQSNDTLWDISRAFGVSLDALCAANGLNRRSVIQPGQRLHLPSGSASQGGASSAGSGAVTEWSGRYTIRSGDTLSGIASKYRVSVPELRRANGLDGSQIFPGNTLIVPEAGGAAPVRGASAATTTYRVRKGDTLYEIARQFGVSVSELRRLNGLDSSRIYPGDVLKIPKRQAAG